MPDFAELKQRHAAVWSAGAFEEVAYGIADVHVALVEALEPEAGARWLDVGSGAGHVSELAAGAGAQVTGIDLSPRLVEVAKARAAAAGLEIEYRVGDAEALDVPDASFDVVSSSFGMIFAPDHVAAAGELARVTRPGGRLGFSSWTPDGAIGDMFKLLGEFQPPPPEGAGSPLQWGDEGYVRMRLADAFDLTIERRFSRVEDASLDEAWTTFKTNFGPLKMLLEMLPPERAAELEQRMLDLWAEGVQPDGTVVGEREYLLVTGIRQ